MIKAQKIILANGLRVLVHEDFSTPLCTVNILYDVGSRDEDPGRTGFAHLFEHLMFGGSANISDFDTPLQMVGGESNAFTSTDITNYYLSVPAVNLETGLWLESDRMAGLDFSEKSLEVQRNVVVEEYRQRYLNQPYGDAWLHLRPLAYQVHPYRWATIGREVSHIRNATMDNVRDFFFAHYAPNNAILVLAGNITHDEGIRLAGKWFGDIEQRAVRPRNTAKEPVQETARHLELAREVPFDALYKAWHIPGRADPAFHTLDLISEILGNGKSSRLYLELVKKRKIFSDISAFLTGELDPGLIVVQGKVMEGTPIDRADSAVDEVLRQLVSSLTGEQELEKAKNKTEASLTYAESNVLTRAMELAFHELMGDASAINHEVEKYRMVTRHDIRQMSEAIFRDNGCSTLHYLKKNRKEK